VGLKDIQTEQLCTNVQFFRDVTLVSVLEGLLKAAQPSECRRQKLLHNATASHFRRPELRTNTQSSLNNFCDRQCRLNKTIQHNVCALELQEAKGEAAALRLRAIGL
jgi:hypothetical protein